MSPRKMLSRPSSEGARREIKEKIGKHYDERSTEERQEEIDWGNFATKEFIAIEMKKRRC